MSLALYRKYRPQTFAELVGQNHIKTTIQSELETGKIAHAYLFSGPRGLGKTTVARLLAKSLNCLNRKEGQSEPCNKCDACKEVVESHSLDVIEIDAASHTGVDNVRENIISNSRFTPTSRRYKVFIIDEVHMLSISAFNALLKTLEEPPAHVIFILATTEIHRIPQTIISRCQRFDFRKVALADIVERLSKIVSAEKCKIDKEVLVNVARRGEGTVRDAESLLGQLLALDEKEITAQQAELVIPASSYNLIFELIDYLVKKNLAKAVGLINKLVQEGIDLQKFTDDLVEVLRKIMLAKIGTQLSEFSISLDKDLESQVMQLSQMAKISEIVKMIDIFIGAKNDLKSADIIQLPLEIAVIEICDPGGESDDDNEADNDGSEAEIKIAESKIKVARSAVNKKPKIESVSQTADSGNKTDKIKISINHVKDKWGEVLVILKGYNQVLASTLHLHRPTAVKDGGIIEIGFKYKFYQQRINDTKNLKILETTLEKVFGLPLRVETVIVKDLPPAAISQSDKKELGQGVDSLLQTFGGQVID